MEYFTWTNFFLVTSTFVCAIVLRLFVKSLFRIPKRPTTAVSTNENPSTSSDDSKSSDYDSISEDGDSDTVQVSSDNENRDINEDEENDDLKRVINEAYEDSKLHKKSHETTGDSKMQEILMQEAKKSGLKVDGTFTETSQNGKTKVTAVFGSYEGPVKVSLQNKMMMGVIGALIDPERATSEEQKKLFTEMKKALEKGEIKEVISLFKEAYGDGQKNEEVKKALEELERLM